MNLHTHFWRKTAFQIVIAACLTFLVATIIAMFTYGGGTYDNPHNAGYAFFSNFFSDLGRTISYNGVSNTFSMLLFTFALLFAGFGLALFFIAFTQFFETPRGLRALARVGSALGVGAGICFIGVALTPANLARELHRQFVLWAFGLFPLAVLCYIPLMFKRADYPRRYVRVFVGFAALLILYFGLIQFGPRTATPQGLLIQATGQKIIVYASILSILIQSYAALRVANPVPRTRVQVPGSQITA